jgi:hypothetical protein|tara:strand:+ start:768 stop:902 length:135 start_codon:yes stop_codon:yes gene_type:complete
MVGFWSWVAGFVFVVVGDGGSSGAGVEAPSGKVGTFEWVEGGAK